MGGGLGEAGEGLVKAGFGWGVFCEAALGDGGGKRVGRGGSTMESAGGGPAGESSGMICGRSGFEGSPFGW